MHCNLPLAVSPLFSPVDPKKTHAPKKACQRWFGKRERWGLRRVFSSRLAEVIHIYSSHEYERIHCIDTTGKGQRHSRLHNVIEENQCGDSFQMYSSNITRSVILGQVTFGSCDNHFYDTYLVER